MGIIDEARVHLETCFDCRCVMSNQLKLQARRLGSWNIWKCHVQLDSQFLSDSQDMRKRIDKIEEQQQSQLISIDVGFGDKEKFQEMMTFQTWRQNTMMYWQISRMDVVEKTLEKIKVKIDSMHENMDIIVKGNDWKRSTDKRIDTIWSDKVSDMWEKIDSMHKMMQIWHS